MRFDLIIIGSGPAGASAAMVGRSRGLSVALIDKAEFPRDKLCGGLFTGRSEKAMRRIFGLEVSDEIFLTSNHMRFSAKGVVLADIPNAPPVHLMMRRKFDAMLHREALGAGAVPFLGDAVQAIDDTEITLKSGETLQFRALIGADGVNSFVARHLFGRPFDPDTIGFGLEIEAPIDPDRDQAVEVDFSAAEWGYGWSFPKHHTTTIGVGGINSENRDMKANMADYVTQTGADHDAKLKGQYLPFGDYKRQPGRGRLLLAGDAAGLVDPITGEGIALAMESGALAAEVIATALAEQAPDSALRRYKKALRPMHRSLDQARLWRMVMFPEATRDHFKKAFARGGDLQMKYLDLLAGDADYNDLRAALLRRLPKLGWRLVKHRLGFKNSDVSEAQNIAGLTK